MSSDAASFPDFSFDAGLPGLLERAALHFPERGIAIFDGRGRGHERRTYPELLRSAQAAAGKWAVLGVKPGERVLVALPSSWAWLEAWLGASLLGALPVAVAPGAALGAGLAHLQKVDALLERLGARHVLAGDGFRREAEAAGLARAAGAALGFAELSGLAPASFAAPPVEAEATAFLQLTSGSTGLPRAVEIPHRAAVHNAWANDRAIGAPHGRPTHQYADSMVSWLPLHHDMGLIGCLFLSIFAGHDLWLFQGSTFLARPRLWLEHLGSHGTAFAPAPNFGYQLCLERLSAEDRRGLDLSRWSDAMSGAEMVRPETVRGFEQAFGASGFRPETFRPCYGLAEATLALTFDQEGRGARTLPLPGGAGAGLALSEVICCGSPIDDTTIEIRGPGGAALPAGEIGEVCASGPGIFKGYWNDPEASAEGLREGFLHTGDLGFLQDGELYITGRLKDILILRGHNLMPHEIEWIAEEVVGGGGALRSGAFSVARGSQGEEAVLVVETTERDPAKLADLAGAIRGKIGSTLSLTLSDVKFVRRGKIPKTTSGKVQRRQLRALYLEGALAGEAAPGEEE
jgi:fatty-acyl-CoA synthase